MSGKRRQTDLNITSSELRAICSQYECDILADDDDSYAVKKAMQSLDKSDFIIFCLYMELGTKTDVGKVLGISRVSASRIINNIEKEIKEKLYGTAADNTDDSVHS